MTKRRFVIHHLKLPLPALREGMLQRSVERGVARPANKGAYGILYI